MIKVGASSFTKSTPSRKEEKMRKYYLEIESYEDDSSIIGLRVVDQATRNRRERFIKSMKHKNIRIDFYIINRNVHNRLYFCQELTLAATKITSITNRELRARAIRKEKNK